MRGTKTAAAPGEAVRTVAHTTFYSRKEGWGNARKSHGRTDDVPQRENRTRVYWLSIRAAHRSATQPDRPKEARNRTSECSIRFHLRTLITYGYVTSVDVSAQILWLRRFTFDSLCIFQLQPLPSHSRPVTAQSAASPWGRSRARS